MEKAFRLIEFLLDFDIKFSTFFASICLKLRDRSLWTINLVAIQ